MLGYASKSFKTFSAERTYQEDQHTVDVKILIKKVY